MKASWAMPLLYLLFQSTLDLQMYVHTHMCAYTKYIHTYIHTYIYIYIYIHTYIHIHIYIYTNKHTHIYLYVGT